MPDDEILVIVNPLARGIRRHTANQIRRLLEGHGMRPTLYFTTGAHDVAAAVGQVLEMGISRIAVAGGDGTVAEVAEALVGTGVAMGIIPLGTGNALALELGLRPYDVPTACHIIATGHAQYCDVGVCNGKPFVTMCGVGLDAEVAHKTDRGLCKLLLGRWGFVVQCLCISLEAQPWQFCIEADGQTTEDCLWAVVVCNGSQYTWRLRFAPGARLDDGLLDVILFRQRTRTQLLWEVGRHWFSGGVWPMPGVRRLQASRVSVRAEPPALWQADGEVRGMTPVEIAILRRALRLMRPLT